MLFHSPVDHYRDFKISSNCVPVKIYHIFFS